MVASQQGGDLPRMTEAEYLAFADAHEGKYEYVDGQVLAMSGGSVRHGTISMSIGTHLSILLRERDCTVTSSDVRVYIAHKQRYRYPDVTVFCGDAAYLQDRDDTLTNPLVLVEVLSPGTASNDLTVKLHEYMRIDGLQAYVVVSQDEPRVSVYQPNAAGEWVITAALGMGATIDVRIQGEPFTLSLSEIYRRVRWDAVEGEDTP